MNDRGLRAELNEIAATASIDASAVRDDIASRAVVLRRHRRQVAFLFALGVATLLVVLLLNLSNDGGESVRVPPVHSGAARKVVPLTVKGPGNCARRVTDGETTPLAATVNDGLVICIVQSEGVLTTYVGGRRVQQRPVPGPNQGSFTGFATGERQMVLELESLPADANGAEAMFCDGTRVRLQPLNPTGTPRFAGVLVNAKLLPIVMNPVSNGRVVGLAPMHCPVQK